MIGVRSDATNSNIILYYVPNEMLNALAHEIQPQSNQSTSATHIVLMANKQIGEPSQQLEFLAKTFLYKKEDENARKAIDESKSVLLGSPIFVAFAN